MNYNVEELTTYEKASIRCAVKRSIRSNDKNVGLIYLDSYYKRMSENAKIDKYRLLYYFHILYFLEK